MNETAKQLLIDAIAEFKTIKGIAIKENNLSIYFSCVSILHQMETDLSIHLEKEENVRKIKEKEAKMKELEKDA